MDQRILFSQLIMTALEGLNAFLEAWEGIFQHLPFKKDIPLLPGPFGTDTSRFLLVKMSHMLETVAPGYAYGTPTSFQMVISN